MNNLCTDIGYRSLNKYGEQLCGDHIDMVESDNDTIIVLADGLGSGVKASILSTMSIEECVATIAATLPVCSERQVAYSTFTIIRIRGGEEAEIIQYDNPRMIFLRGGKNYDYPVETMTIGGKSICRSKLSLCDGDLLIAVSDGALHAGVGRELNFGWERSNIIDFMETLADGGFTAKTLTTILLEECNRLYGGKPGDDTTVCTVRIRKREPMNLMFGPPVNRDDQQRMISLFFAKEGKHIVCGGTTSTIVAKYLNKPLRPELNYSDPDIPPTASIEGVDLVTEGVITINRVVEYAKDYLMGNEAYSQWSSKQDGASRIARLLFEEATDINLFVGRAINPAHQNPDLPISFNIKMRLTEELESCLKKMGKRVRVSYF